MNETEYSEFWAEIGQKVINANAEGKFKPIVEFGIGIGYVVSKEAPQTNGVAKMAECIPVKRDDQRQFIAHDYLIKIYEPNVAYMTNEQKMILMEHELMHIHAYENKDGDLQIRTTPHDCNDFRDIIEKYGYDWAKDVHQQMTLDEIYPPEEDAEADEEEAAETEETEEAEE